MDTAPGFVPRDNLGRFIDGICIGIGIRRNNEECMDEGIRYRDPDNMIYVNSGLSGSNKQR